MSPYPASAKVSPEVHQLLLMRGGDTHTREEGEAPTGMNAEHHGQQPLRLQLQLAWKVSYSQVEMWEEELVGLLSNTYDKRSLALQPTRTAPQEREANGSCYSARSDAAPCSARSIILSASTASVAAESLARLLRSLQAIHWVTLQPETVRLHNHITTSLLQSNILPSGIPSERIICVNASAAMSLKFPC